MLNPIDCKGGGGEGMNWMEWSVLNMDGDWSNKNRDSSAEFWFKAALDTSYMLTMDMGMA